MHSYARKEEIVMRRLVLLTTLIVFIFALPTRCEEAYVLFESFEDSAVFDTWSGGFLDDSLATDADFDCAVVNPYGEEINGRISHILSYLDTVYFEADAIYKISFDVINLGSSFGAAVSSGVRFGDGARNIVFEFAGISDSVTEVSQFFMVPQSDDYSFSIELKDGDINLGFIIDRLTIQKIDLNPQSLTIIGETSLTIPASGEISSSYTLAAYSSEGEIINILSDISTITAVNLPAGVTFDSESNTVTVNEYCPDNAAFTLECTPPDSLPLASASIEVSLTRNVLKNHDFSRGSAYWEAEPALNVSYGSYENYISLYTDIACPYGSYAVLRPTYSVVLTEGVMYVLRARVQVEGPESASVYSQNTVLNLDGNVTVNILDLSAGDWIDVIAAFTPEASGVYDISLNFITPSPGTVNVSSITLSPEFSEETYITLHAPGNISVSPTSTVFPFSAYVRDQSGAIVSSRCELMLYPEQNGVELTDEGIVVSPDAIWGEYEIRAIATDNTSIESSLTFTVSDSNIGDGGFEERRSGEWWAAAAPASLSIEEYGEGKYGKIVSDYDYAVVINNSYMHLYADLPYAFRGSVIEGDEQTVTAFIEAVDGEKIPIVQFTSDGGDIFELFQTENDIVGRLMLYISSDGRGIDIGLDNLELFRAIVGVSAPTISGLFDCGATVEAKFNFYSNLDNSLDYSDCAITWYTMNPSTEESERIGSGLELTIPADALGKYIYYEIVPICKITGLSGDMLKSVPVLIGSGEAVISDQAANAEAEEIASVPSLTPITLCSGSASSLPFADMSSHWASEAVAALYEAGVIYGKTEDMFYPDEKITRGEFAALICRTFNASGGECAYVDVSEDDWYRDYVACVSTLGIMNGMSEEYFCPDDFLSREQMATVLMRIYEQLGYKAKSADLSRFYDHNEISSWAQSSVAKGLYVGIINGTATGTFMPKSSASRAEACVMLYRMLEAIQAMSDE